MMKRFNWERKLSEQLPALLRYARALTHNEHAAEDLLQDCLERAWSRRAMFDITKDLRVWLFTIMHNLFVNHVRKLENRQSMLSVDALDVAHSDGDHLILRDFEKAMQKLRPEYREILLLVGVENLAYSEVAEVLDIAIGTVMSRLSRARESLRVFMQDNTSDKVVKLK